MAWHWCSLKSGALKALLPLLLLCSGSLCGVAYMSSFGTGQLLRVMGMRPFVVFAARTEEEEQDRLSVFVAHDFFPIKRRICAPFCKSNAGPVRAAGNCFGSKGIGERLAVKFCPRR